MQILMTPSYNTPPIELDVEPSDTIKDVKNKICDKVGFEPDEQKLVNPDPPNQEFENDRTLSDYNITNASEIRLIHVHDQADCIFVIDPIDAEDINYWKPYVGKYYMQGNEYVCYGYKENVDDKEVTAVCAHNAETNKWQLRKCGEATDDTAEPISKDSPRCPYGTSGNWPELWLDPNNTSNTASAYSKTVFNDLMQHDVTNRQIMDHAEEAAKSTEMGFATFCDLTQSF